MFDCFEYVFDYNKQLILRLFDKGCHNWYTMFLQNKDMKWRNKSYADISLQAW